MDWEYSMQRSFDGEALRDNESNLYRRVRAWRVDGCKAGVWACKYSEATARWGLVRSEGQKGLSPIDGVLSISQSSRENPKMTAVLCANLEIL